MKTDAKMDRLALITVDRIAEEFILVKQEIEKFDSISKTVTIVDDDSLAIAENNAAQIKVLLNRLEKARKTLKEPYFQTSKMIDMEAKFISDDLGASKQRIGLAITNWRTVQEATARAILNDKKKKLEKEEELKRVEADKFVRLTRTSYAKLYGGTFITKTGEEKMSSGCSTEEECEQLATILLLSFPPIESFTYFPERRDQVYLEVTKKIRDHKINIMDLKSNIVGIRTNAIKRINQDRLDAGLAVLKTEQQLDQKINLEIKKEISAGEKEIKEAAKGTMKILKFRLDDEEKVTREFLSVDTAKVRSWMEGKHDDIKKQLFDGIQPVSGIYFYIEEVHIAR